MAISTGKLALGSALILGMVIGATPAHATFPGRNGRFAYGTDNHHIHLSGTQLAPHGLLEYDFSPSVSPDGTKVAFIRQSVPIEFGYYYRVMVVDADGGVPLTVASSADFGEPQDWFWHINSTAWTADGDRVSFLVQGDADRRGVWTVGSDGSGLTRTVASTYNYPAGGLNWSPVGRELVYPCTFREDGSLPVFDFCVFSENTGVTRQLRIDYPHRGRADIGAPNWTQDGEKILFHMEHKTLEGNNTWVFRWDIFSIDAVARVLTKLSDSGGPVCPRPWLNPGEFWADATYVYQNPAQSPSGDLIATIAWKMVPIQPDCTPLNGDPDFYTSAIEGGIYKLNPSGKPGTLLHTGGTGLDWEPIPVTLKIDIDDGHGHPLKGLKVQLTRDMASHVPTHNEGGSYFFHTLAPGDYVLRATLIDDDSDGLPTAFSIHHDITGADPVWIERNVHVPLGAQVTIDVPFALSSSITDSNVPPHLRQRLDDMAAIYYRVRQFVDWFRANLSPNTGPPLEFSTFASAFPYETEEEMTPDHGSYLGLDWSQVLLGTELSRYELREGTNNEAPENGEWHEFVHHLFDTHIWGHVCDGENHQGYSNETTCDSLYEGFAAFLPAIASHDIDGTSDSRYADMDDLEGQIKAWDRFTENEGFTEGEDSAVAALFWDLVDTNIDSHVTEVVGADGLHHVVTYNDTEAFTLTEIWNVMTTARPNNVRELRTALGNPEITVDLDADLVPDVAPLDEVFLMHGFFPIDAEQGPILGHTSYHYDVAAVQREFPGLPRNDAVGYSDHRIFNWLWEELYSYIPRLRRPAVAGANLGFDVVDASGTPLAGAVVELTVHYPGVPEPQVVSTKLDTGDAALMRLQLPPYHDYRLPVGATLPPCDPLTDTQVDVTVRTILNGYVSTDTAAFDNCQYQQAIATATGPAALEFTASFPEDSTAPTSTIFTMPTGLLDAGGATVGAWVVRFACTDPEVGGFASGCWRTEYSINGGPLVPYTRTIELTEVGSYLVELRSVDGAGNEESFQSVTLDIVPAPDTDGDGLTDPIEDGLGTNPNDVDTDDDGLEDGDEILGGTNPLLADSDSDGLSDSVELGLGTNPNDLDTDDDGLYDGFELAPGLDPLDPDVDDDGALDGPDKCRTLYNPAQRDSDGDGLGELCDNCPQNWNVSQIDMDGDGAGDACDCAASDPSKRKPASPSVLASKSGSSIVLSWAAVAGADAYSVTRGDLAGLAAGDFGPCFASSTMPTFSDPALPPSGGLFVYLVQGQSLTCGIGSLGLGANEALRTNLDAEACGPAVVDDRNTISETSVAGELFAGNHLDTHSPNSLGELIAEEESGGSPSSRYGLLEHRWVVDVAPGDVIQILVEGERAQVSNGDDVRFEWSTDGTTFTPIPMGSLPYIPDGTVLVGSLAPTLSGPVTIRVVDTVRTPGSGASLWLWIDWLAVRSISF